jgi:phosphate transport system protein
MSNLDKQLEALKDQVVGMMQLVRTQLSNANTAFLKHDESLALEVIHYENRVNAMELSIDKECEKIFALYKPVAVDLRFVIATLKVNTQLERIGDHAKAIAKYTVEMEKPFDKKLLKKLRYTEMVETVLSMIDDAIHAFNFENTKLARWIFGKDATINEITDNSFKIITALIKENPNNTERLLKISSTIRKLERVGDLVKNIAEETVFYTEAKVLKHKKKKGH